MYNWNSERKFPNTKSSSFNFAPKNFNSLIKTSFESINYSQLPVIKEEEDIISEEELESQSREKFLPDTYLNKNGSKTDTVFMGIKNGSRNQEQIKTAKTFTKLPPLVNINCLMNADIKQSHHIWDTNFGKRLIQGKSDSLNAIDKVNSSGAPQTRSSKTKERTENSTVNLPSRVSLKKKSFAEENVSNGGGDTMGAVTQKKANNKKPKKTSRTNKNLSKKFCQQKDSQKDNNKANEAKSNTTAVETHSKEKLEKRNPKDETVEVSPTHSSFSKNRHFLTECVRSILDSSPGQLECEHCKEEFDDIEELCKHRKEHESKKEVCLLCDKVFYNPHEFVEHLLTHEGVDQFSCKKCRKYFPNLKKYKQHCRDVHSVPEKTSVHQSQISLEFMKSWLPKYECKRCKLEFDSEREQEEHKRTHIKRDLAGAYLLSPKNFEH